MTSGIDETPKGDDLIAESITEAFGERCPDFDADCFCCRAWKQYDDLRSAAKERDEAREGWQDIETAPKDRPILLFEDGGVGIGQWGDYGGKYNDQSTGWIDALDGALLMAAPTHWQPLPALPAKGGEND